jgi:hypothetical protein
MWLGRRGQSYCGWMEGYHYFIITHHGHRRREVHGKQIHTVVLLFTLAWKGIDK